MKNEVIPVDGLVISEGTTAGELPVHVCACVYGCVCVYEAEKLLSRWPWFEYVIFYCIIGGLGCVTAVVLSFVANAKCELG